MSEAREAEDPSGTAIGVEREAASESCGVKPGLSLAVVAVALLLALAIRPPALPAPEGIPRLGPLLEAERGRAATAVVDGRPVRPEVRDEAALPGVSLSLAFDMRLAGTAGPVAELVLVGVPPDSLPVSLPRGRHARLGVLLEPVGAQLVPPARLRVPNLDRLPPGAELPLLVLRTSEGGGRARWVPAGRLVTSADGGHLVGGPIAQGGLYAVEAPPSLAPRAWQLLLIFLTAIALVMLEAMPIFVASVGALAVAVLTGVLGPVEAFSGFSEGFILLIAVAFLIARGVVKSGLGRRIAYLLIARLGRTTLGLSYSLVITDLLIAPAFPSNTARAGVLFPIAQSLALGTGSRPDEATRRRTGAFLMMMAMTGLSISSAMWLTAMAGNPTGAAIALGLGIEITFRSWALAAALPSLAAVLVVPLVLYRAFPPEVTVTPEAPGEARRELDRMGPMSGQEWVMAVTFLGLVVSWALSGLLGIDKTAIAFAGLFVIMVSGIFTVQDLEEEGGTLEVLVWFAILYALSTQLHALGFMTWLGSLVAGLVTGYAWPVAYAVLLVAYVFIHYFFVSQSAQMLALFPVFLTVGVTAGVPPAVMAYLLLFATNFFSVLTPQASSANVIFVGSGYLHTAEVYRHGALVTLANTLVYGLLGPLWILLLGDLL